MTLEIGRDRIRLVRRRRDGNLKGGRLRREGKVNGGGRQEVWRHKGGGGDGGRQDGKDFDGGRDVEYICRLVNIIL